MTHTYQYHSWAVWVTSSFACRPALHSRRGSTAAPQMDFAAILLAPGKINHLKETPESSEYISQAVLVSNREVIIYEFPMDHVMYARIILNIMESQLQPTAPAVLSLFPSTSIQPTNPHGTKTKLSQYSSHSHCRHLVFSRPIPAILTTASHCQSNTNLNNNI